MAYGQYAEQIKAEIEWIKSEKTPIALFGVSNTSKQILKVLQYFQRQVVCFLDNDKTRQETEIEGLKVLAPEKLKQSTPEAAVIVGLLNNDNYKAAERQLKKNEIQVVLGKDSSLLLYYLNMVKNDKSEDDLLRLLYSLSCQKNREGIIFDLSHFITHKCTLQCENCGAMVSYYKNPKEYPASEIDLDLHKVVEAADGIYNVNVLGGEPFLHSDIVKICEDACREKKVLNITITTNATFVPKIDFAALARTGVIVNISDYGEVSSKKEELVRILKQYGIVYTVKKEDSEWYEVRPPKEQKGTWQEWAKLYRNCILRRQCVILLDGKLYPCNYVALFGKAGLYQKKPGDYVDVRGEKQKGLLHKEIVNILHKENYIPCCAYCDFDYDRKVRGGVQKGRLYV